MFSCTDRYHSCRSAVFVILPHPQPLKRNGLSNSALRTAILIMCKCKIVYNYLFINDAVYVRIIYYFRGSGFSIICRARAGEVFSIPVSM